MEPELAIDAGREAIKVCFMVGGPILAVCLAVGLLMGLAQAMSHIQDQALATVPKILTIFAVVAFALPWFSDRMVEFSEDQFSNPFMTETSFATLSVPDSENTVRSLIAVPEHQAKRSYYPTLNAPKLDHSVFKQASHAKPFTLPKSRSSYSSSVSDGDGENLKVSPNPFSLPSYRFSKRESENLEG